MRAECFRKALMRKENKDYKHLKKEDTAPAGSTGRKLPWILFAVLIVAVLLGSVVLGMNYRGKAFGPAGTAAPDGQDVSETEDAGQEDAKPSETEPEKSGTGKEKTADAGEKTYKVFIETGHGIDENGKWDPGCSWSDGTETYEEARIMIPVAAAMTKYLRQSGVEVYTDAETDNGQNLMATLDFLETHKVDAFVNLHCDWENSGSGTMPLYRTEEQKQLAVCLNEGVHSVIDIPDRGLAYREDLDTLNSDKPGCPACLFETGSIDDDFEILTEHYDEYGKGLAKGMCSFLGVVFVEE